MNTRTTNAWTRTVAFATLGLASTALGQDYQHTWQEAWGGRATFRVSGPATQGDVSGDAKLGQVDMPNGEVFEFFYTPVEISDVRFTGQRSKFSVRGGIHTTYGVQGDHPFPDVTQGGYYKSHTWSAADQVKVDAFADLALEAFSNSNLNNYVDVGSDTVLFSFVVKFNLVIKDNDPAPDEFGELLYFERGAGSGNSWLKMRAVDEHGSPLGPWLVIGPHETVQTTPVTTVMRHDQKMGTTAVDVSRLGVSEVQYLEVSNDVLDEPAYTGGGDQSPDFKLMAVMTNAEQIVDVLGIFD